MFAFAPTAAAEPASADHTPTFEATVTLPDGRVYVGSCAASKKDAEKLAALAACRALLEEAGEPTASLSGRVSGTNLAPHVNPINELQEMCQGAGFALPAYEEVAGDGRQLAMEVTLPDGRSFGGTWWQKAKAKRAAAQAAVAHYRANSLTREMTHTLWEATGGGERVVRGHCKRQCREQQQGRRGVRGSRIGDGAR